MSSSVAEIKRTDVRGGADKSGFTRDLASFSCDNDDESEYKDK